MVPPSGYFRGMESRGYLIRWTPRWLDVMGVTDSRLTAPSKAVVHSVDGDGRDVN
jgi:hypothetical protein